MLKIKMVASESNETSSILRGVIRQYFTLINTINAQCNILGQLYILRM